MLAGKLLSALLSGIADRTASVRKANSKAIGHLVKVCIRDCHFEVLVLVELYA